MFVIHILDLFVPLIPDGNMTPMEIKCDKIDNEQTCKGASDVIEESTRKVYICGSFFYLTQDRVYWQKNSCAFIF